MISPSVDDLRDFALYSVKTFQDLLKAAADKSDSSTFHTVLEEFNRVFHRFLDQTAREYIPMLEFRLQQATPAQRPALERQLEHHKKKRDAADRLRLARDQVMFGLASWMLETYLKANDKDARLPLVTEIISRLPDRLPRLATVFDSVMDHRVADYWGWHWWGFRDDGEAHWVDSHTAPNRLFCVRALQLLARMDARGIANVTLPAGENMAFAADERNAQGLVPVLNRIADEKPNLTGILDEAAFARAGDLAALLRKLKADQDRAREDHLIAAALAPDKIEAFKQHVVTAFHEAGRMRPLISRMGGLAEPRSLRPDEKVPSLGYNQLDDKGAFIPNWHVSYPAWGEAYGRGLAQSEDQVVFQAIVNAAAAAPPTKKHDVITSIERLLAQQKFTSPVIIQTVHSALEYEGVANQESFISRYRRDCPDVKADDLDAFSGVLNIADRHIPVFELFIQSPELQDRVVIAEIGRLLRWQQFVPIDQPDEANDISENLLIRVSDLNADDALRRKIMAENPKWLQDQPDPERFLRMHVIVNVYDKFKIDIIDGTSAICMAVQE